ncbi:MAG TPA: DASS family sodium-coupled anion symporter [Nitrospiraceae bacterium]|nr:DASS family sodium-coupled anion symporter [Nitrospiraceae bacterium]
MWDDATQEVRTAREARWTRLKRAAAYAGGPAVAALILFASPSDLPRDARVLAAILTWVVLYWIAEPIPLPVTGVLGTALCILVGLGSLRTVLASYGHPVMFLLIGSLLLAEAMAVHGVAGRFAATLLSAPWEAGPKRALLMIGTATAGVSMWISNTAATALMLPIALRLTASAGADAQAVRGPDRAGPLLLLSFAATAGGMATVIGTPTNVVGVGLIAEQIGTTVSFTTWMAFGGLLAFILLVIAWGIVWWLHPSISPVLSNHRSFQGGLPQAPRPWTRGQANVCVVLGVAILLWLLPGLVIALGNADHPIVLWFQTYLPNERVALLAAGLLFVLPADLRRGERMLSWRHVAHIRWDVLVLFGSGLTFGALMEKTGLADFCGRGFVSLFGAHTLWSLTAVSIAMAVLISELVSNTVTATMAVPLTVAIAQATGVSPLPPALGATLGASLGFALPISTPPNAIIYSTGFVPLGSMIRAGLIIDMIGVVTIWAVLRLLCPVLGLI